MPVFRDSTQSIASSGNSANDFGRIRFPSPKAVPGPVIARLRVAFSAEDPDNPGHALYDSMLDLDYSYNLFEAGTMSKSEYVERRQDDTDEQGDPLDYDLVAQCIIFFRLFADACHHGKEEDLLFTELEAQGMPRDAGPIAVMLDEHAQGRALVRTMAAALEQALETSIYSEIIMTRVTVPVGEDIGFLPGTEEEKMAPWMGALMDNLEVLTQTDISGEWGRAATNDLLHKRIKVRSLNFMRGRTFLNRFIIPGKNYLILTNPEAIPQSAF